MRRHLCKALMGLVVLAMLSVAGCGGGGGTTVTSVTAAEAGPAQSVAASTLVTLDASQSTCANGAVLNYLWSMQAKPVGSTATLSNPGTLHPTFAADLPGTYLVKLVVTDSTGTSAEDTVTITVTGGVANTAPVANAGAAQSVVIGALVTLDGSGSSDADGDPLSYSWALIAKPTGSTAALSSTTVARPTFTADLTGSYQFTLVVNDGTVNSAAASVTITVTPPPTLSSIEVTPAYASLGYNATRQLVATGHYSDGSTAVLTSGVTWTSTNACSLEQMQLYVPVGYSSTLLGDQSPLGALEKLVEARRQFNSIYALAKTGDATAIDQLQSIGTTFLTISLQFYGVSPMYYADDIVVVAALDDTASLAQRDPAAAVDKACALASLRAYRNALKRGPLAAMNPNGQLQESQAQFNDLYTRALLKDAEAVWQFESVADAYLTASSHTGDVMDYLAAFSVYLAAKQAVQAVVLPAAPASITGTGGLATGEGLGTSVITATAAGKTGSTGLTTVVAPP